MIQGRYAPCDAIRQQVLWNNISVRLASLTDQNICVCDDFNAVRCIEERRSVGSACVQAGSAHHNQFIVDNCLVDLPLSEAATTHGFEGMGSL